MDADSLRVMNVLPQLVGCTGADLRCQFANRAYAEFLETTPEKMIGLTVEELWGKKLFRDVKPYIERALAGETVQFSKRILYKHGEPRFGKATLIPLSEGGYMVVIEDLSVFERNLKDRDRLIHELDHRVNNILQILESVIALESQVATGKVLGVLESLKARVDALALSYEQLRGIEPDGGWPAGVLLDKVAATVGAGISATFEAETDLRIPHASIDAFIFIATELARWVGVEGYPVRLVARRLPDGIELAVEGSEGDPTLCAGAAGIALVDSFAKSCGAGPLRGGIRPSIIFPLDAEVPIQTEV